VSPRNGLKFWVPVVYVIASAVMVFAVGVPTSHDLVFLWFAVGMAAFSVTDLRRRVPRLVIEWAPFIGVLFVYDRLRGFADGLMFQAREYPQIHVEAALFGKPIPTVWLQSHLWHGANHLHWWDYLTWFVYLTHFFATLVVAAVLWTMGARQVLALRDDGVRPCADRLRDLRAVPRRPSVARGSARIGRGVEPADRERVAARPDRPLRLLVREGADLREQRGGDAVAARGVRTPRDALSLADRAAVDAPGARALPARDWRSRSSTQASTTLVDCLAGWVYATASFVAVNLWFERRSRRALALEPALAD